VTGTAPAAGALELKVRVAKVCGCPSLSVRPAFSHQEKAPSALPIDALACLAS
jgi:hypothetical protein